MGASQRTADTGTQAGNYKVIASLGLSHLFIITGLPTTTNQLPESRHTGLNQFTVHPVRVIITLPQSEPGPFNLISAGDSKANKQKAVIHR